MKKSNVGTLLLRLDKTKDEINSLAIRSSNFTHRFRFEGERNIFSNERVEEGYFCEVILVCNLTLVGSRSAMYSYYS